MRLNLEKLNTFGTTMQMTLARKADRFTGLSSKQSKTTADLAELDRLSAELVPFDLDQAGAEQSSQMRPKKKPDTRIDDDSGIVMNVGKINQANLTGAQRLSLHRQSVAMGRLLGKPAELRSVQEAMEFTADIQISQRGKSWDRTPN